MGEANRIGDLQVDQDLELQKRFSRVKRIGWACPALFVLAGLAGLIGPGQPIVSLVKKRVDENGITGIRQVHAWLGANGPDQARGARTRRQYLNYSQERVDDQAVR